MNSTRRSFWFCKHIFYCWPSLFTDQNNVWRIQRALPDHQGHLPREKIRQKVHWKGSSWRSPRGHSRGHPGMSSPSSAFWRSNRVSPPPSTLSLTRWWSFVPRRTRRSSVRPWCWEMRDSSTPPPPPSCSSLIFVFFSMNLSWLELHKTAKEYGELQSAAGHSAEGVKMHVMARISFLPLLS